MSVKKQKLLLQLLTLLPFAYYLYLLIIGGQDESYFFHIYNIIAIFAIPFLASKYISIKYKKEINPVILFAAFPITYLLAFLISKISPISASNIISFFSILIVIKFVFLKNYLIWKLNWGKTKKFLYEHRFLPIVIVVYTAIFLFIRDINSIVALDYLQHLSITEKMQDGALCLIPNQCSELFIQVGYTTIYHAILGFITSFSNSNALSAIFILDLLYPLLIAILTFNILKRFNKNNLLNSLFALATILVFINGSYETTFFIPQTLAFVMFLIAINEKDLDLKNLLLIILILFLTHFVIGVFFAIFLIIKYLLIDKLSPKILGEFSKYIVFFAIFTPIIFLIINSSGFSIESSFQKSAVESIGGFTNLMFPRNIFAYLTIWGGTIVFLFMSIALQKNKKKPWYLYSIIYLSLTLSLYLLAPTYANKFLLGSSVFASILMLKYLSNFKDQMINVLIAMILIICLVPNFYFKSLSYLSFYRQHDNVATAVPVRDTYALKHIKAMESDCIFVSDPLTQIQVESLGNKPTAKAQYIKPDSRRRVYEFANNQTNETYSEILKIEELEQREMCFIYSSRLHTAKNRQDINWLFHTYSLPRDSSNPVQESTIKSFMEEKGYNVEYQDPHFIIFKK
jgi:hypothetical protein